MKIQTIKLLLFSFLISFSLSCSGIKGEGDIVIKDKSIPEKFSGISLSVSGDVFITSGTEAQIMVHGQQNIIDVLDLDVNNNTLSIGFTENKVRNYDRLKFYITTAALEKLNISGSGNIVVEDSFANTVTDLNISGSGNIKMPELTAINKVKATISGSGNIELAGSTENTEFNISGSGNINAFNLHCKNSNAHISGSGNIETTVSEKLDAHISGSGDIKYKGRPVINVSTSGTGKVIHID